MSDERAHVETGLGARLDLLERTGVISSMARRLTEQAVHRIADRYRLALNEETAGPLVTHVAVALTRVEQGGAEVELPAVADAETAELVEERAFAEVLRADWEEALDRSVPDAEVGYLVLHLALLLRQGAEP